MIVSFPPSGAQLRDVTGRDIPAVSSAPTEGKRTDCWKGHAILFPPSQN